jgi:hypothetical protein
VTGKIKVKPVESSAESAVSPALVPETQAIRDQIESFLGTKDEKSDRRIGSLQYGVYVSTTTLGSQYTSDRQKRASGREYAAI